MKRTHFAMVAAISIIGLRSHGADLVKVGEIINETDGTATVLKAPKEAVNQTFDWQLGKDPEFLPLQTLIENATQEAQRKAQASNLVIQDLVGVDWRRNDTSWRVTVHFHARIRAAAEPHSFIRDGDVSLSCHLLPNGVPMVEEVRPLSTSERTIRGLPNKSGPLGK